MKDKFKFLIRQNLPRILTQVCRDVDSDNYGCWDRNFWHYKIRDFASIILQQGGYLLAEAAGLEAYRDEAEYFKTLAKASVDFWHQRARHYGAFEEYYPYERSYPALAFSTLAIAKTLRDLQLDCKPYAKSLQKAIRQLETRREFEASNQYLAGLAALYVLSELVPEWVSKPALDKRLQHLLERQSSEGWFNEYGGPDLGYLSVSLDCLWDIYDISASEQVLTSIRMAITFIDALLISTASIGMHNSRQTDYVVPYGIVRMALQEGDSEQTAAERIIHILFGNISHPEHFFQAIDDRYWVHYIGHSLLRAYLLLESSEDWGGKLRFATASAARSVGFDTSSCRKRQDDASTIERFPESGYIILRKAHYSCLISTRKGGILSLYGDEGQRFADYGTELHICKEIYVMNWWGSSQLAQFEDNRILVKGSFVTTKEHISSPIKHLLLRIASFTLGASIISTLKKRLIFSRQQSPYKFTREITMGEREIRIVDRFSGFVEATSRRFSFQNRGGNLRIATANKDRFSFFNKLHRHCQFGDWQPKAAAFSKRHVASANSYNIENAGLIEGFRIETTQKWVNNELEQTSTLSL